MKWLGAAHNNVNANISLAQFSFNVQLMDSYSTDYYEIAYPGLIMRVMMLMGTESVLTLYCLVCISHPGWEVLD